MTELVSYANTWTVLLTGMAVGTLLLWFIARVPWREALPLFAVMVLMAIVARPFILMLGATP